MIMIENSALGGLCICKKFYGIGEANEKYRAQHANYVLELRNQVMQSEFN